MSNPDWDMYKDLQRKLSKAEQMIGILERGSNAAIRMVEARDTEIARLRAELEAARCKLVNRAFVRVEALRALVDYATHDKQFPIDEPFNQYLRETFAAIDSAIEGKTT